MRPRLCKESIGNPADLIWSNLEGKAELWYSKLLPIIKDSCKALKREFLDSFAVEDMDREARLVDLCLKLSNLKQGETENVAEFVAQADILSKKLAGSQVDVGMAIT